ncbi:MAG: hypothetical protein ACRC2O_10060, partial [Chitinophagaceae bacterium]
HLFFFSVGLILLPSSKKGKKRLLVDVFFSGVSHSFLSGTKNSCDSQNFGKETGDKGSLFSGIG